MGWFVLAMLMFGQISLIYLGYYSENVTAQAAELKRV